MNLMSLKKQNTQENKRQKEEKSSHEKCQRKVTFSTSERKFILLNLRLTSLAMIIKVYHPCRRDSFFYVSYVD